MKVVLFVVFLLVSHFGLMQIFRLSTYHAYFWKTLPLLLGYSALVGWLLFVLGLHEFFLWQVILASIWLFVVARRDEGATKALLDAAGKDADSVRFVADSTSMTRRYYSYSSFLYVAVLSLTYLWFLNA